MFYSQSQNSSAKLALFVDDFFQNFHVHDKKSIYQWNQLDETIYVSVEGFGFHQHSFYFRAFKKVIDRLIESGTMSYLAKKYYMKQRIFMKVENELKVLSLEDLSFGFNIWLGSCFTSALAFAVEKLMKRTKIKGIKFTKIYPMELSNAELNEEPKNLTNVSFKVKRKFPKYKKSEIFESKSQNTTSTHVN